MARLGLTFPIKAHIGKPIVTTSTPVQTNKQYCFVAG